MKPTVEVLREARELLADPERWVQGNSAVNGEGHEVAPRDADACSWCLYGAAEKVGGEPDQMAAALTDCVPAEYRWHRGAGTRVAHFNDAPERTHDEILGVLTCAIAKAEAPA